MYPVSIKSQGSQYAYALVNISTVFHCHIFRIRCFRYQLYPPHPVSTKSAVTSIHRICCIQYPPSGLPRWGQGAGGSLPQGLRFHGALLLKIFNIWSGENALKCILSQFKGCDSKNVLLTLLAGGPILQFMSLGLQNLLVVATYPLCPPYPQYPVSIES